MAQLGTLFATRGDVDQYFLLTGKYGPKGSAKCECVCGCDVVALNPDTVPYLCSVCSVREMRGDGEFHHLKRGRESHVEPMEVPEDSLASPAENESALQAARIQTRIAEHMMTAAGRERAALQKWAAGYCDGLDRALRIARRQE